ncbi:Protein piccolo [Galemys pyrenaicus]|uniref:Protein piccolo n=1 Tax=Galemys pyrenaicus TaxID=202257 RepID=A0A8J6A0L6_GALPY|nr:Protein piccolo [Galemys pyrenaicus]
MGNEASLEGEGLPEELVAAAAAAGGGAGGAGSPLHTVLPAGMEADLSQLSEEERRQIAAVMSRAQGLPKGSVPSATAEPPSSHRHAQHDVYVQAYMYSFLCTYVPAFVFFYFSRKQELDSSHPPKQPGKPPDPGRPTQPGLSKSRTTDTFRSEQKLPGRSPSTISLKESKSRTDFKEEHKSSMMPGFFSEVNPLSAVSSVVNKFNPFDLISDSDASQEETSKKQKVTQKEQGKSEGVTKPPSQQSPKSVPKQQGPVRTAPQRDGSPKSISSQQPEKSKSQPPGTGKPIQGLTQSPQTDQAKLPLQRPQTKQSDIVKGESIKPSLQSPPKTPIQQASPGKVPAQQPGPEKLSTPQPGPTKSLAQQSGSAKPLAQQPGTGKPPPQQLATKPPAQPPGATKPTAQQPGPKSPAQPLGPAKPQAQQIGSEKPPSQQPGPTSLSQPPGPAKPSAQQSGPGKTPAQQPAPIKPSAQQTSPAKPSPQQHGPAKPSAQQPVPAKPSTQQTSPAKPSAQQPAPAKPSAQQPISAKPSVQQPAPAKPSAQQPAPAKPSAQQPISAKPSVQQPAPAKPSAQQPAPAKPSAQQPAPAKPSAQQPVPAKPSAQQPAPTKPSSQQSTKPVSQTGARRSLQPSTSPSAAHAPVQGLPKTICPLCNTTELLLHVPEKANFNTCTECQTTVCSLCGFNPNPHLTEIKEWLCLNCQMQRALGGELAPVSSSPQPKPKTAPVSPTSAPSRPPQSQPASPKKDAAPKQDISKTPESKKPPPLVKQPTLHGSTPVPVKQFSGAETPSKPAPPKEPSVPSEQAKFPITEDKPKQPKMVKSVPDTVSSSSAATKPDIPSSKVQSQDQEKTTPALKTDTAKPSQSFPPTGEKVTPMDSKIIPRPASDSKIISYPGPVSEGKGQKQVDPVQKKEEPKKAQSKIGPKPDAKPMPKGSPTPAGPRPTTGQTAPASQQPSKPQEQPRRFSLNLGSITDAPKSQPTTPQETVTGKLFGFGASIFSQASSLISTAGQPASHSQSVSGASTKQVPPPSQPPVSQGPPKSTSQVPPTPTKATPVKKETKAPVAEKLEPKAEQAPKIKRTEAEKKPPPVKDSKPATAEPQKTGLPPQMEKTPKAESACPLCKTELNVGSKDPPNFNTCTECKKQVCNLCGFNPTPHLTEVSHVICIHIYYLWMGLYFVFSEIFLVTKFLRKKIHF